MTTPVPYPAVAFHFLVQFEGVGKATIDTMFQDVGGLQRELAVETLEEGGENRFVHRLPGRAKYGNLILKRGLIANSGLIAWFRDAVENLDITPVTLNIMLLELPEPKPGEKPAVKGDSKPLVTWKFTGVWPVKWSVGNLSATSNAVAVDTIELAYQFFRKDVGKE